MGLREFVSPQVQRFGSASGVIAEAWLRMTTGAAYNDEEMQTAIRTFIPLPNEPPEVSARKAMYRRRLGAMMSILAGYDTPTDMEGLKIYDLPPEVLDLLQKGGQLRQIQHHLSGQIGEALPPSAQRRDYEVDETYLTPEERELIRQRREGGG